MSKAYKVIQRFSEDVDLTYDIRALAPDLVGDSGEALPKTPSQEKRWTSEIRKRLPEWIAESVQPLFTSALEGMPASIRLESEKFFIDYETTSIGGTGYAAPSVMLEFGARSTGEPASEVDISCDAAGHVEEVIFPTARPRVMHAERTFWEKATAVHVFCLQERMRGERFSRHWHDLVKLDEAGFAERAFADRELATAVARHKSLFFAEKAANGSTIDYAAAVHGGLRLAPVGEALQTLKEDYAQMIEDGLLLLEDAETFESLMGRSADIAVRANRLALL